MGRGARRLGSGRPAAGGLTVGLAVWIVCAWVFVVFFGTWAVQIALWLAVVAWRLLVLTAGLVWGILSIALLTVIDRPALMRLLRNQPAERWN